MFNYGYRKCFDELLPIDGFLLLCAMFRQEGDGHRMLTGLGGEGIMSCHYMHRNMGFKLKT